MPHLDSNIPSNIYYAYIGSKILWFARTTLDKNTFLTLTNLLLKRMHKRGNKHRSIISMLNKMFGKHFTIYCFFFPKLVSLSWIRTTHIHVCLLCSMFPVSFFFFFFACLCGYNVIIALYLHLYIFLRVGSLYYNFTIISI